MDEHHYTSLPVETSHTPDTRSQENAQTHSPVPKLNSTLALVVLGLFTAGIMFGYLLGRSSTQESRPLLSQTPTDVPAVSEAPVGVLDSPEPDLRTVSYAQNFSIAIPEPQNCRDCIISTDTFLQVVSRGEPVPADQPARPSLEDWRFTVQEMTGEASASAGLPAGTLSTLLGPEPDLPERIPFTNTETGEETELIRVDSDPIQYYQADTNSFGTGFHQVIILNYQGTPYLISFEYLSEAFSGVFEEAVVSFSVTGSENDDVSASDSAVASGPAQIINQEEPEFLLQ